MIIVKTESRKTDSLKNRNVENAAEMLLTGLSMKLKKILSARN